MTFFEQLKKHNNIELTEQQKEAIINTQGYNLLLACPGSGKTTVMVVKTAYLINEKNIHPTHILSLTFSKAASKDMQKRYKQLFGNTGVTPIFSTIHAFCFKIMREYFYRKGLRMENIEGHNSKNISKSQLLASLYEQINGEVPTEDIVEDLCSTISYFKNMMMKLNDIEKHDSNIKNIKQIYIAYDKKKNSINLYDFDDMLLICYKAFKEYKDILERYRNQFKYIQVDEAQDNSKIQNAIVYTLVTKETNLFMVADDDQTIYEWRGAYPEAILKFGEIYKGANLYKMEHNFRSSLDIVATANAFIKNNKQRHDKNLITNNPPYQPINIVTLPSEQEITDFIMKNIRYSEGKLSEHAVLFRNNITAVSFAEILDRNSISFCTRGYKGHFFGHWVVKDIKAFFEFSMNQDNLECFDRIYYKNNGYISVKAYKVAKLKKREKQSIIDAIYLNTEHEYYRIKQLKKLKVSFNRLTKIPIQDAINYIEKELGYKDWYKKKAMSRGTSPEAVATILSTLKLIAKNCTDINSFLNRLEELKYKIEQSTKNIYNNSVVLTTVHSSKGLEFDNVYLVELIDGVFPSNEAISEAQDGNEDLLEAERRLFYVGMTRARYNLYLLDISSTTQQVPSMFVGEVMKIINPSMYDKRFSKKSPKYKSAFKLHDHMSYIPYGMDNYNDSITHSFNIGDKIKHNKYGEGEIHKITATTFIINFKNIGLKTFGIKVVINNNLIVKI